MGKEKHLIRVLGGEIRARIFDRIILAVANFFTISIAVPFAGVKIFWLKRLGIKIMTPSFVDSGFDCLYPHNIAIGKNCSLGHHNKFWAFSKITLGDHVQTALGVTMISGGHATSDFTPLAEGQEITLEGENWIGANVTILGGVVIGRGAIIGAGSVVVHAIPPFTVAAGVPARVIRARDTAQEVLSPFGMYRPSIEP